MRFFRGGKIITALAGAWVVGGSCAGALAGGAWTYSTPRIRLPLMKAPAMKGAFKPAQWAGADEMVGLCANGPTLAPQPAKFWVGGDAENLYIAVVSGTPPGGKLLERVNPAPPGVNPPVIADDDVEIIVDPSPDSVSGRVYQAIINARGAIWQQAFQARGTALKAWHGHWRVSNKIIGNRWYFRVAIPWRDFGIRAIRGRTIGLRVCRDFKQVPEGWWQTQWSPLGGAFVNPATLARVTFDPRSPVVQTLQLQNKPNRPVDIRLLVRNPGGAPLGLRADLAAVPRSDRPVRVRRTFTLAPHQSRIFTLRPRAVAGEAIYTSLEVASADGGKIDYQRNFQWTINRPARIWQLNQEVHKRIDTAFMYDPSIHVMQVKVNVSDLADKADVTGVRLEVRDQKTGQIVASTMMPPLKQNQTRLREWKIPPLNGKYDLVVRLVGVKGQPQLLPFVRYHFKWEHNQLGRNRSIIVRPFKALAVKGRTVEVVLRQCTMNGLGLWGQVKAQGQNLLSGPMRIVVRAGGKRFVGHGEVHFTRMKPTEVVAVAAWSAGPLAGSSRSVWDYDGMMKTTLTLEPTQEKLDSVSLVIPMVNKQMPLMTACTDGLRFNYSGKVPGGEGEVWNGSEAPRNSIMGSFVPYIWTGGPVRGVAVFGDNDAGWVDYQAKTPCQELVRKADGTLELRLNLVAKPARLKTAHKIVLGFQATPIKPMPKDWRLWTSGYSGPHARRIVFGGACIYWGCRRAFGDIYPRGHDFSIYHQLELARKTGKVNQKFIHQWLKGYPGFSLAQATQHYGPAIEAFFNGVAGVPHAIVVTYTNPAAMRVDTRAGRTYLSEWDRHVYPTRQYTPGEYFDFTVNPCRSFRDFAVWYYDKLLGTFDDSIYWDNMFLKSDFNTVLTNAYRLPDGYVQPSTTLWTERALVRRTALLDAELHKPDLNMIHMTNTAIAPILSFARIDLDLEDKYGSTPFQTRFSRAFLLTEIAGRQFGNVPVGCIGLSSKSAQRLAWIDRTYAGVMLTMEIRGWEWDPVYASNLLRLLKFGYGRSVTKTWDYWRKGYPMRVSGDKTSSIIVSKAPAREAMIVICDWGHGGMLHLRLNQARLGLPGSLTVMNAATGRKVALTPGGAIALHLRQYNFKMLLVRGAVRAKR